MSGRIVPVIGGPLDGQEMHRTLSTSRHCVRTFFVAGRPTGQHADVHVYEAKGSPNAPYRYEGIRPRCDREDTGRIEDRLPR